MPVWIHCRNGVIHRKKFRGKYHIESNSISCGMIRIGWKQYFYHKSGVSINNQGTIVFSGAAIISNESVIDVRPNAILSFGKNFGASIVKIICANKIEFGDDNLIGINTTFMDCDFHVIYDMISQKEIKPYAPIIIGNNNWFGFDCLILKGTKTPDNCIISAKSVLNRKYKIPENSILGNKQNADIIAEGYSHSQEIDSQYNEGCFVK